MKRWPNIIIGLIDIFIGILISFAFLMFYFFSDFSYVKDKVWIFQIIYLGLFQALALFFIIRGFIHFFEKPKKE